MKKIITLGFILIFMVACGGQTTNPAPAPTNPPIADASDSPTPTLASEVAPTEPPLPTDIPESEPTDLPPPVVATNTPAPEPTSEPTATPLPEPTEEPEPEYVTLTTAEEFAAENRNPLTGLVLDDSVGNRRPILCKISNSPPEFVWPQSGLNDADIIFEHYTEAAITRFSALFYGSTPEKIGPVRSARLIDLELPLMYDASLCFSGGSTGQGQNRGVYNLAFETGFASRILNTDFDGYYRTGDTSRPYEHTFYMNPALAWDAMDGRGLNAEPQFVEPMVFSEKTPKNSAEAGYISIDYGDGAPLGTFVEWEYDETIGKYLRTVDGVPMIDENDGEQVAVSNVIILKAPHVVNRNICETQTETQCIAFSTEIQIWGKGFLSVFRDGRQINGEWRREDRYANGMMFTFYDDVGNPIPLQLGNTWIQVAPYEYLPTPIEVAP